MPENTGFAAKNPLTKDGKTDIIKVSDNYNEYLCTDTSGEYKAKNPLKCKVHGEQYRLRKAGIGINKFIIGFNDKNLKSHFRKHRKEYPGLSEQDYNNTALELIQKPCGADVRGYVRENGQIVRYNRITGDYVIGNNDEDSDIPIGIATMFKIKELAYDRFLKEEAYGDEYY